MRRVSWMVFLTLVMTGAVALVACGSDRNPKGDWLDAAYDAPEPAPPPPPPPPPADGGDAEAGDDAGDDAGDAGDAADANG